MNERIKELANQSQKYAIEWLDETECWVWGPVEVTDEAGDSRVVCADEDGNMIDFIEE